MGESELCANSQHGYRHMLYACCWHLPIRQDILGGTAPLSLICKFCKLKALNVIGCSAWHAWHQLIGYLTHAEARSQQQRFSHILRIRQMNIALLFYVPMQTGRNSMISFPIWLNYYFTKVDVLISQGFQPISQCPSYQDPCILELQLVDSFLFISSAQDSIVKKKACQPLFNLNSHFSFLKM